MKAKALHQFTPTETASSLSAVFPLLCGSAESFQWSMKELAALEINFYMANKPDCCLHLPDLWGMVQRQREFNSPMFPKCFEIFVLKEVLHIWKKTRSLV